MPPVVESSGGHRPFYFSGILGERRPGRLQGHCLLQVVHKLGAARGQWQFLAAMNRGHTVTFYDQTGAVAAINGGEPDVDDHDFPSEAREYGAGGGGVADDDALDAIGGQYL